ncbi:MAG: pyridoxal phosphate-dependent aminotransferase [Spirochaetales bacterium]
MDEGAGTPWSQAHEAAQTFPDYLDLTDSRFHQNDLTPPAAVFYEEFERWLGHRAYVPDSRGALPARTAVANFYGPAIAPDDVFLTAGTSEAYLTLFTTLAQAGEVVGLPRPGYPLFEHLAERARLKTAFYDQPFVWASPPPDNLRLLVVISPNNPTGKVYRQQELAEVGEFCRQRSAVLVFDEVFDAFTVGGVALARPTSLPAVRSVTLNGISKRFGSPDLKLAWMALSGPQEWRDETSASLEFANDLLLSANSYSQALLPRLFRELEPWQQAVRDQLAKNRDSLEAWLASHPEVVALPTEGGIHGLLSWPGLPRGWDDERWSVHLLNEHRLALHPGYFYDVQDDHTLVYSLLKKPALFRDGLERLSLAWRGLGGFR